MKRHRLNPEDYTVGWICALSIELAAALEMLDEEHQDLPQDANDTNLYTLGRIGKHNVVLACLPEGQMGTNTAVAVAVQMKSRFTSMRFGLLVGIGGGVPGTESDVRLGDVVVSTPHMDHGGVIQYDFGKTTQGKFVRTGFLNTPPVILLNALAKLRANHRRRRSNISAYLSSLRNLPEFARDNAGPDVLFERNYNHAGGSTCDRCERDRLVERTPRGTAEVVVHYGIIASGNQVMKDGATRDRLSSELGGVLCFDMEAAGLMNCFPCLVIRGICDYADSHKNKNWQPYAAATAAACAKEVLSVIPASEVATTRTVIMATASFYATEEKLQSAIDSIDPNQLLDILSVVDQEKHISTIPPLDCGHPMFYWIFRNIDFKQWTSVGGSQVLWLSGLPERNIDHVSSYIVNQKKSQDFVLYFFCSTVTGNESIVAVFVHTLLHQIVCCSQRGKIQIIRRFLRSLLDGILKKGRPPDWREDGFKSKMRNTPAIDVKKILNASANEELWAALEAALVDEQEQELIIVVDGLDKVRHQKSDFVRGVRRFSDHLQQRTSNIKILLTSQPESEIRDEFDTLGSIEYDKERKECLASLCFDNTRFGKILKEHKNSFAWLWTHREYKAWSTSDTSQILYIKGKPGSGKSTLTRYFNDNLLEHEPNVESAIVAKFFYSDREGELQKSHYSMLRSILYDILDQDEIFFYHRFQIEYRRLVALRERSQDDHAEWDYKSLKTLLLSLSDHSSKKRLYLIIDAVDESDDKDRRDILNLLFDLCLNVKYCVVKIFIASRPVSLLERSINKFHNIITMQEETKPDISRFARSFLEKLEFASFFEQAMEYIVEKAQGVFVWVQLVKEELLAYDEAGRCTEENVFEFLKSLPTELEELYKRMLGKIGGKRADFLDGLKMLRFVLFACKPLTVSDLLHALTIPDTPLIKFTASDESFRKKIPLERLIIHCGGNFLEIKRHDENRTVQVIHQTVREFFLRPGGYAASTEFRIDKRDAHKCIAITCIRYLMLCAACTSLAKRLPNVKSWASGHFEDYAKYLEERPFAIYALCYLKHHVDNCYRDPNVLDITSQFINELTQNPAVYLLESWASSHLNKTLLSSEQGSAAGDFRNKILQLAVRKMLSTAAEVLLIVGADVNARDKEGKTPLWRAAWLGDVSMAKLLLARSDIDVNLNGRYMRTPLWLATERGHEVVVKLLLAHSNIYVNSKDNYWRTPLWLAVERGHEAIVKLLLVRSNVDVNSQDCNGFRPLWLAAERGHEGIVRLLLARSDVNVNSNDGNNRRRTPLSRAAELGHEAVVKLLLAHSNINVNSKDEYRRTPLWRAAEQGHEAVVRLLLVHKNVDVNLMDEYRRTPLSRAAERGHESVAKLLLAHSNIHVNLMDNNWRTPLWLAVERGHEAIVKLLLARSDVDVNSKDYNGRKPLWLAAERGHEGIVRLLLACSDINIISKDKNGATLPWLAAEQGHDAVQPLNAKAIHGNRALHRAAENGYEGVVRLLLEYKADIAIEDDEGETMLHRAARKESKWVAPGCLGPVTFLSSNVTAPKHLRVTQLLLYHKADAQLKTSFRRTLTPSPVLPSSTRMIYRAS